MGILCALSPATDVYTQAHADLLTVCSRLLEYEWESVRTRAELRRLSEAVRDGERGDPDIDRHPRRDPSQGRRSQGTSSWRSGPIPKIGAQCLGAKGLEDIRSWVLAHHERPDGKGYPRGLTDEQIPLEAKILAVADAYEAMTADRPYRAALGDAAARTELLRCSGGQFDARIVSALLAALTREARSSGSDPVSDAPAA